MTTEINNDSHDENLTQKEKLPTPLNISQDVADIIELDLENPTRIDPLITGDLAGNQLYMDIYAPDNFNVSQKGWWKIGTKVDRQTHEVVPTVELICRTRLMLTGKYVNADTGADVAEISFVGGNKVECIHVPYVVLLGNKEWKDNVRKDNYSRLEINDEEISEVRNFLREVAFCNMEKLDPITGTSPFTKFKLGSTFSKTGWKNDNTSFVLGSQMVFMQNQKHHISSLNEVDYDSRVIFEDMNVTRKFLSKGDYKKWVAGNKEMSKFPITRFMMYSALAATILDILSVDSFAEHIWGPSGIGKTTDNMVAASQLGDPSTKGLMNKGDSTEVSVEGIAKMYNDLPIFIEDTTHMPEKQKDSLFYTIGNEIEKGRGKKEGGNRERGSWKTIALLTGEAPLLSKISNDGAKVRVIEIGLIQGEDFQISPQIAEIINISKETNYKNYGHIIIPYLKQVLFYKDQLKSWFNDFKKELGITDNITDRKANQFAAIYVAGRLAEIVYKDIGLPAMDPKEIVKKYWNRTVVNSPMVLQPIEALELVYNWIIENSHMFVKERKVPSREVIKNVKMYGCNANDYTYDVIKGPIDDLLQKNNINLSKTYYFWQENNITECGTLPESKGGGLDIAKNVTLVDESLNKGFQVRMIVIKKSQIDKWLGFLPTHEVKEEIKPVNKAVSLVDLMDMPPKTPGYNRSYINMK